MTSVPAFPVGLPAEGEVRVWWSRVDLPDAVVARLRDDLDDARRARLDRFHQEADRRRGTVAHGLLRRVVGGATGVAPREVSFGFHCGGCGSDEHGKPHVVGVGPVPQISLSHSGDLVAVALAAPGLPVGVDVERIKPTQQWEPLRRSVFTDREWAATAVADDPPRARYGLWVAKEAALKAIGTGLATPMNQVGMEPVEDTPGGDEARFRCVAPGGATLDVASVTVPEGHLAAIAAIGRIASRSVRYANLSLQ